MSSYQPSIEFLADSVRDMQEIFKARLKMEKIVIPINDEVCLNIMIGMNFMTSFCMQILFNNKDSISEEECLIIFNKTCDAIIDATEQAREKMKVKIKEMYASQSSLSA